MSYCFSFLNISVSSRTCMMKWTNNLYGPLIAISIKKKENKKMEIMKGEPETTPSFINANCPKSLHDVRTIVPFNQEYYDPPETKHLAGKTAFY